MRIAVIDLGTNTCNLLLADCIDGNFKILHQSKLLVKLGDGKIKENEISPEATQRALNSFLAHKKIIEEYEADKVRVIATSAVRTAKNKLWFLECLSETSGWLVKLISGEREAELIFKGVLLAFDKLVNPSVILDIGGGSNELILAEGKKQIWKESQPTGMARIVNSFQISNPIRTEEIKTLQNYFVEQHIQTIKNCNEKSVKTLIGCSGAFDTIADLIDEVGPGEKQRIKQEITLKEFNNVYEKLIHSTREQRTKMKGMDEVRIDLIVPAVILIKSLLVQIGIQNIIQTDFALREGVLSEIMENQLKLQSLK